MSLFSNSLKFWNNLRMCFNILELLRLDGLRRLSEKEQNKKKNYNVIWNFGPREANYKEGRLSFDKPIYIYIYNLREFIDILDLYFAREEKPFQFRRTPSLDS